MSTETAASPVRQSSPQKTARMTSHNTQEQADHPAKHSNNGPSDSSFALEHQEIYTRLLGIVLAWVMQTCKRGNIKLPKFTNQEEFLATLVSGVILCRLVNTLITPQELKPPLEPNEPRHQFAALENLAYFASECKNLGVPASRIFRPSAVVKGRCTDQIVRTLATLAVLCAESGYVPINIDVNDMKSALDQWDFAAVSEKGIEFETSVSCVNGQPTSLFNADVVNILLLRVEQLETSQKQILATYENRIMALELSLKQSELTISQLNEALLESFESMHRRVAAVEGLMCTSTDLQSPRKPSALNLSELSNLRSFTPVSGIHTPLEQDGQIGDSYFAGSADSAGDGKSFMSTESPRPPLNTMGTMASFNSTLAPQKSFLPPEISSMELSKQELLRQRVIYELIQTEGDYVRDLQYHLADIRSNNILSEEEKKTMFSNVEKLITINKEFLDVLLQKSKTELLIETVGESFLTLGEIASPYTDYCGNYPNALQLYRTLVTKENYKQHFERWQNNAECRGLSFESFLIKPVQRLCKYPLLIKELLRCTPETCADYESLLRAQPKIEELVQIVNEGTRQLGEQEKTAALLAKIVDLPPATAQVDRKLVREGLLQKVTGYKSKERFVMLFEDLLLIGKPSLMNKARYQLESQLQPDKIIVKGDIKVDKGPSHCFELILIGSKKESIVLSCSTEEEKSKWATSIIDTNRKLIERRQQVDSVDASIDRERPSVEDLNVIKRYSGDHTGVVDVPRRHIRTQSGDAAPVYAKRRYTDGQLVANRKYNTMSRKQLNEMRKSQAHEVHINTSRLNLSQFPSNRDEFVSATSDFIPSHPNQLGFSVGSALRVVNKDRPDIWKANLNNVEGFIPSALVVEMEEAPLTEDGSNADGNSTRSFASGDSDLLMNESPELVEIDGNLWKRAEDTAGNEYYFRPDTKETCWRLPDRFLVVDPLTGEKFTPTPIETVGGDNIRTELVPGYPDWVRIECGTGAPYYYNTATDQTSWSLPTQVAPTGVQSAFSEETHPQAVSASPDRPPEGSDD